MNHTDALKKTTIIIQKDRLCYRNTHMSGYTYLLELSDRLANKGDTQFGVAFYKILCRDICL